METKIENRITFDYESRSRTDLKKCGAYKYSVDPSTQMTCMAFKEPGNPKVYFLDFGMVGRPWSELPFELRKTWKGFIDRGYQFSGHNVFFDSCLYKNIAVKRLGWPEIPDRQYRCTAAKAAACALPRSLAGAGEAMKLRVQKDFRGYAAMMATCKPTKAYIAWEKKGRIGPEPKVFLEPEDAPEVWQTLYTYCRIDVKAEEELDQSIPDLIPQEQEIWFLNQKLNWRGLRIDIPLVEKIVGIMKEESGKKLKQLDTLTMGLVTKPGARASILEFLELEGVKLPNLQKKTVEDKLNDFTLSPDMYQLLELRKALSLSSTKKYQSFISRAGCDHRVRDILLYHGASTGRDTGTGIQPHNFPRNLIKQKEIDYIIKLIQGAE